MLFYDLLDKLCFIYFILFIYPLLSYVHIQLHFFKIVFVSKIDRTCVFSYNFKLIKFIFIEFVKLQKIIKFNENVLNLTPVSQLCYIL